MFHPHYENINKIWDKDVKHEYLKKVASREMWEQELADQSIKAAMEPLPAKKQGEHEQHQQQHSEHHEEPSKH